MLTFEIEILVNLVHMPHRMDIPMTLSLMQLNRLQESQHRLEIEENIFDCVLQRNSVMEIINDIIS